jgi:TolB protein
MVSGTLFAIVLLLMASLPDGGANAQAKVPVSASKGSTAPLVGGGRIAFASMRDGQNRPDIYTMNPDGTGVVRLTTDPTFDHFPDWSHDGSKIAFSSSRDHPTTNQNEIYVMNADGSGQHIVATGMVQNVEPSWSPDGSKIAFLGYPTGSPWPDIHVMNADGSGLTRLTFTTNGCYPDAPSWSPNGSTIAFDMPDCPAEGGTDGIDGGTHSIYIINATGGTPVSITAGENAFDPAWSPDGASIAFSKYDNTGSHFDLWKMGSIGGGETLVTSAVGNINLAASWSPDGQRIVFSDRDPGASSANLYVVDASGANKHDISGSSTSDVLPDWGDTNSTTVLVQNEQGTPVPRAQVYRNGQGASSPSTLVGTTDMSGTVQLPNPALNEYLIARSLVYTGTTSKGNHDGWAYHVYLTNINEQVQGAQSAFQITDTALLTQTVTISHTHPLIGFNIVASVEYNATGDNLSEITTGFAGSNTAQGYRLDPGANDYLLDVADGQMFLEKVTIYEDKQNWGDADYQFFAYYPRADAGCTACGPFSLTHSFAHIHAQGSDDYGIPWNQTNAYTTLIHEFGHYAVGAYDEYRYLYDGDPSTCSLSPNPDYQLRDSIMSDERNSSEFCTQDDHNPRTFQNIRNGESVWQTLKDNWDDDSGQNQWSIQSPIERGFVDRGPLFFISHEADRTDATVVPVQNASCAPIPVLVTFNGIPVTGAKVSLTHNGYSIDEGVTDTNGKARIYGAEVDRDTVVAAVKSGFPSMLYTASADITTCDAITIPVTSLLATQAGQPNQTTSQGPNTSWPTYWLTATANFGQNQVHATLHFTADPSSQPSLYASQDGTNRQQITLTYDPAAHNYTGDYPLNASIALKFQFEVGLSGAQGVELFPYTFDAAQFHADGPDSGNLAVLVPSGKLPPSSPTPTPSMWDLFSPENMVSVSVSSTSLISGTGVMVGQVDAPDPIDGLVAVGGPYSLQGENPIADTVYAGFEYQSEYFCGLQAGSVTIYRYDGAGWEALPSTINEERHLAATSITQWGIYAVFAQPNPQVVFSDVPAGSTFYDYINWITCHSIASGYADGTFRTNNNATRGQISKMVANAFRWRLEAPVGGNYSFTDAPPGSTFFLYIEAAYREGIVSGYPCGGAGEACDPQHRPYFRPNRNVTRGQIAKIISNAALYEDAPVGQAFQDVAPGSTFYTYTQRIASRSIINGYPCGGAGEPCVPPTNRPYFRPNANATRGQLSKIIYLALAPR